MVLDEIFNKIRSLSPFKKHLGTMPLSVTRIYSGIETLVLQSSTLGIRAKKLKPTWRFNMQEFKPCVCAIIYTRTSSEETQTNITILQARIETIQTNRMQDSSEGNESHYRR